MYCLIDIPACKACCVCRQSRPDPSLPTPCLSPADNALRDTAEIEQSLAVQLKCEDKDAMNNMTLSVGEKQTCMQG